MLSTIGDSLAVVYSQLVSDRADDLQQVGQRVRELRRRAGETQAETASAVGISRPYLSEVENGANVTLAVIYGLAEHFGVTPASLLGDVTEPRRSGPGEVLR